MAHTSDNDAAWHDLLMEGKTPGVLGKRVKLIRRLYGKLPAEPRCKVCNIPFGGGGGRFTRVVLRNHPSTFSMHLCGRCEGFARSKKPGADVDLALVFADIRGSTPLAESMPPLEYSGIIDRFYNASAEVFIEHMAIVEKLAGDQVAALFVPGLAGGDYVRGAINAAISLMQAYGYGGADGAWISVGAGVHVGNAFVGMVGTSGRMTELTSLGDAPNVTARLASSAAAGEILVSDDAARAVAELPESSEVRELDLKGKAKPIRVHVISSATT